MSVVIEVKNLTKKFNLNTKKNIFEKIASLTTQKKQITALDNLSFSIKKGEVVGIIGYNGSGKTTLLQTIAGIYSPDSGTIKVSGSMAPVLQIGSGFNTELDATENIIIYGMLLGLSKKYIKSKIHLIMEYAEINEFSELKLKHFSAGMKSRLAVSTIFQLEPDILLLDEILAVGDFKFREKCFKTFISLKEKNRTILISTHALNLLPLFCDRVLLINKGKLVAFTSPNEAVKQFKDLFESEKKSK
ncbi:MAG TPA: ABC transporter ATP-binding protein [Candidatus Paceibacterota bacterium]|nr:ABC transporter ATP-binding protein [Candidatus Paceibacterota bacterium]